MSENEAEALVQVESPALGPGIARILGNTTSERRPFVHAVPYGDGLLVVEGAGKRQPSGIAPFRPSLQRMIGRAGSAIQVPEGAERDELVRLARIRVKLDRATSLDIADPGIRVVEVTDGGVDIRPLASQVGDPY